MSDNQVQLLEGLGSDFDNRRRMGATLQGLNLPVLGEVPLMHAAAGLGLLALGFFLGRRGRAAGGTHGLGCGDSPCARCAAAAARAKAAGK